jgi:hypothetical protein
MVDEGPLGQPALYLTVLAKGRTKSAATATATAAAAAVSMKY